MADHASWQSLRLVVDQISQRYGNVAVFSALNFAVEAGHALVITGANGVGKSTLLLTIAGLMRPSSGSVRLDGLTHDNGATLADMCHLVGSQNAIKLELTVYENVRFWSGIFGTTAIDRTGNALEILGLERFSPIPARALSTGWRRRLCLARVLLADRPLWLLDEPTATLDDEASALVRSMIENHLTQGGIAVIATHLDVGLATEKIQRHELVAAP
jgi:heme exporter protein A